MNFLYFNYFDKLSESFESIKENINFSFEFFPPKTDDMEKKLWKSIDCLSSLKPNFFSITYGATGKFDKKNRTYIFAKKIKKRTGIDVAAHLTCVNLSHDNLVSLAKNYWKNNIRHIVALRGDFIENKKNRKFDMYGKDLVILLKSIANFDITVAAYPEVHPEAKNPQFDLINLKQKVDAGANRVITQFFFNVEKYLRFRDRCASIGINTEIIPGILPIINFSQIQKFAKFAKIKIPYAINTMFLNINNNLEINRLIGFLILMDMIKNLVSEGIKNFHFYTLNSSDLSYAVCFLMSKYFKKN